MRNQGQGKHHLKTGLVYGNYNRVQTDISVQYPSIAIDIRSMILGYTRTQTLVFSTEITCKR